MSGGGLILFFLEGAQHPLMPKNPEETIDFTDPGGGGGIYRPTSIRRWYTIFFWKKILFTNHKTRNELINRNKKNLTILWCVMKKMRFLERNWILLIHNIFNQISYRPSIFQTLSNPYIFSTKYPIDLQYFKLCMNSARSVSLFMISNCRLKRYSRIGKL